MTDKIHTPPDNPTEVSSDTSLSNRRKLIRSGVTASLLVTTVASRSAWGGNLCTRSGLNSANLSGQHTFPGCSKSAGYWKEKDWPSALPKTTSFTSIFGSYRYPTSSGPILYDGKTLNEVIQMQGQQPNTPTNLGLHLIGAYVNSIAYPSTSPSGKGFAYSPAKIISMFQNAAVASDPQAAFATLKNTLEFANDQYDGVTDRYVE